MIEHNRCHTDECDAFIPGDDKYCNDCVRDENNRRMKEANQKDGYMAFSDIMEENGKTIRENRSAMEHKYSVGTLVEIQFEEWESGGACSVGTARMWVVEQNRDCDGSPLYSLSFHPPTCISGKEKDEVLLYYPEMEFGGPDYRAPGGLPGTFFNEEFSRKQLEKWKTGYSEESLTEIEVTPALRSGKDALKHPVKLSTVPYKPEMHCASCDKVTTFEHIEEHHDPKNCERPDWICTECDWMQTSTEGGYCETVVSWLCENGDGLTSHESAKEQLGKFIWRTCQGEYSEHYADVLAKELVGLLARLKWLK